MVNDIDKVDLNSIGSQALLSNTSDQDVDFYSECELESNVTSTESALALILAE